ncbi:MAG: YkgJ family cysteine cluster protein [Bacteroidia bacterium]
MKKHSSAKAIHEDTKKFFLKLKRKNPKDLDNVVHELHHEVFAHTDCLTCANCCKTTSPIFSQKDIERLSKYFKIRPSQFIEKYLHEDADKDFVLNSAPCTFLDAENLCTIYDHRPTACREYPHTDRKKFYQLLDLTLENVAVCPAVAEIAEKLKLVYEK